MIFIKSEPAKDRKSLNGFTRRSDRGDGSDMYILEKAGVCQYIKEGIKHVL